MERITRQHQAISQAIADAGRPLLAQEILDAAALAVPQLSLATVYRQLKLLQNSGAIQTVMIPGQNPRYELRSEVHQHHFQCRYCDTVYGLHSCPGNLSSMVPEGFELEAHDIILYGCCQTCAAAHANNPQ